MAFSSHFFGRFVCTAKIQRVSSLCLLTVVGFAFGLPMASAQPAAPAAPATAPAAPAAGAPAQPQAQQSPLTVATLIADSVDNPDDQRYKGVAEAIEKFRNRDFDGAQEALRKVKANEPKLAPVEIMMAKMYAIANQPQLLRVGLEQAVQKHPQDPEAYLLFAELAIMDRHITNAAVLYEKSAPMIDQFNENSLRKSAFRKRLLNGTATVAESRGEWAKAEKLLRELIAMDDENIGASQRLGRAIFQQAVIGDTPEKIKAENKMYSDSFQAFLAALKHDPKQLNPNIALGQLFEQKAQENIGDQKKFDYYRQKAAGLFKEATSKAPNDQAVLLAAASWALQTSQFKLAEQYADLALKADTNSADAKLARAIVARFLDDSATAEKLLSEAFTQSPANFAIINQLALALIDSQDSSKRGRARDLAEMNFRQYQQSPEALATLGWVYYVTGDLAKAEQALGQLLTANALNADSAYYVAKLFVDRGKLKEAKEILKMALDNPKPFASRIDAQALSMEVDKLIAKGGEAKASDAKKTETKAPAAK